MSGGVDSSVAAYLLQRKGYSCVGVTFDMVAGISGGGQEAAAICGHLGIPHRIVDVREDFERYVVRHFVDTYVGGATPNPCIECNRHVKFNRLLGLADSMGIEHIATGHYARVRNCEASSSYMLMKGTDASKDQSYMLYTLSQDMLGRVLFPLGGITKKEVRAIAASIGLVNADREDSQDICFVRDGDYAAFIDRYTGKPEETGDFIDADGNAVGRHKGLIHYTIGQRKGLGIAFGKPVFVRDKDVAMNTVTICGEAGLMSDSLYATELNWTVNRTLPLRVMAKTRYRHAGQWATVLNMDTKTVQVVFDEPQRAITKGQAVVFYDGDIVLGGGTIL